MQIAPLTLRPATPRRPRRDHGDRARAPVTRRWSAARRAPSTRRCSPARATPISSASASAPEAFAILRDFADPHGNLYLKRIAVATPGRGDGVGVPRRAARLGLRARPRRTASISTASPTISAPRRCTPSSASPATATLREAYLGPDGRRRDLALMALTRPEWLSRAARRLSRSNLTEGARLAPT